MIASIMYSIILSFLLSVRRRDDRVKTNGYKINDTPITPIIFNAIVICLPPSILRSDVAL